jgi:hypothetical protein
MIGPADSQAQFKSYLHYSACLVSICLANHPHYPTNLSANLPQLNGNKNTPESKTLHGHHRGHHHGHHSK